MTELARAVQDWFNPHWTETRPTVRESSPEAATVGPRRKKMPHTPTPWRTEWNPTERGEPATLIMQAGAEMWEKWVANCPWGKDGDTDGKDGDGRRDCSVGEAQANAAFIVLAANSHVALVEALEELIGRIEVKESGNWTAVNIPDKTLLVAAIDNGRTALALAKPKE